jgi:hypothetical protein
MPEKSTSKPSKPSEPLCLACTRTMRLIFAEPDPVEHKKEKRIYQCETCQILETVILDY